MNRFIHIVSAATAWLVLPLVVLLFAQWPLREWVQAYSRQINDVAQIVFALLVSVAVTTASAADTHLSAAYNPERRARWRAWALLVCVLPWALLMLWASAGQVYQSVVQLEKFSETLTPGFFILKLAMLLLYLLVIVQAVAAVFAPHPKDSA